MSAGGFLVSPTILNPFWKYVFHYDYVSRKQSLLLVQDRLEFADRILAIICLQRHDGQ